MNSLTRRVDKLEEERALHPETMSMEEALELEKARQRVLAACPDREFCDLPPDPSLSFVERLERGRQWALQRIRQAAATEARQ